MGVQDVDTRRPMGGMGSRVDGWRARERSGALGGFQGSPRPELRKTSSRSLVPGSRLEESDDHVTLQDPWTSYEIGSLSMDA